MATTYEITCCHTDGRVYLVGYTCRTTRLGLLNAMRVEGASIVRVTGMGETDELTFAHQGRRWVATLGDWTIGFSGRTKLDVASTDAAHPYIAREC
jgi:hypothetical protein